jgi:hypothetical protein
VKSSFRGTSLNFGGGVSAYPTHALKPLRKKEQLNSKLWEARDKNGETHVKGRNRRLIGLE